MEAPGIDSNSLDEAGWGIIFPASRVKGDASFEMRSALQPLLALRQREAGRRYREFVDGDGYRPGDTTRSFLARHSTTRGRVDPERMPYYLLLAGDPGEIPFDFQRGLSIDRAVGRIAFGSLDEYASYARSVALAEQGRGERERRLALFGAAGRSGDGAAAWSRELLSGLASALPLPPGQIEQAVGAEATKARFAALLENPRGPGLLVVSGHGVGFPSDAARRQREQGALLCGNWAAGVGAGSASGRAISSAFLFAAHDVSPSADVSGRIAFLHASFSVGSEDKVLASEEEMSISPRPAQQNTGRLAPLAQALLAAPKGGMLAVVGWTTAIWSGTTENTSGRRFAMLQSALGAVLDGQRLGYALEPLRTAYAQAAVELAGVLEEAGYGSAIGDASLADLWMLREEAGGCIIIGDPAVRLAFVPEESPVGASPSDDTAASGAPSSAATTGKSRPAASGTASTPPAAGTQVPYAQSAAPVDQAAAEPPPPDEDEKLLWEGTPLLSRTVHYRITTQRIRTWSGLLGQDFDDIELTSVEDIALEQTAVQRLTGTGNITVRSNNPSMPVLVIKNIREPETVKELLRKAVRAARSAGTATGETDKSSPYSDERSP